MLPAMSIVPTTEPEVSLVIPVKNESAALDRLFDAVLPILAAATASHEIIVVDDGSGDDTLSRLLDWQRRCATLRVVELSRNFGKEAAVAAGLGHCRGRCAIVMDADLQDPPELIPRMLAKWREGYEMVVAVRSLRAEDAWSKRVSASWFYRIINAISDIEIPAHAGDFRLLDAAAIRAFLALPERARFNKGMFAWIGFRTCQIAHERPARRAGESKWGLGRLLVFALDGITSFSSFPLRIWSYLGFSVAGVSLAYGAYIVFRTLVRGIDVPGYASLFVAVMFLNGITLIGIGVLGEYVGRIFLESKRRPLFIVRRVHEPSGP